MQEKKEEVFCCADCDEESKEPFTHVNCDGEPICDYCFDNDYFKCDRCGEVECNDNSVGTCNGDVICNSCYENDYFTCDSCNEILHNDSYYDDGICDSCHENEDCDNDNVSERKYYKGDKYCTPTKRAFSTEIECYYPTSNVLYKVSKTMNQDFGVTGDGSLNSRGIEFQTPKLSGEKGKKELIKFCDLLKENKFTVDKSCGLHIHLDVSDYMNIRQEAIKNWGRDYNEDSDYRKKIAKIQNLMVFHLMFESVLLSYLPKSRRRNRYCFPMSEYYHEKEIMDTRFIEDIETLWYRETNRPRIEDRKKNKYDDSRYCGINFHSMLANKHIEIRYHGGTILSTKILNWIHLHVIILDKIYKGEIGYSELTAIKYITELSDKQDAMFKLLKLPTEVENYFRERAKMFLGNTDDLQ